MTPPPATMTVPLSRPSIGQAEIDAVMQALQSSQLSIGPWNERFEAAFAEAAGCRYAVSVNSGTSGLHLAVRALGIGPGDEVITSPFSFIASANCMLFEGAKPVFVDVEAESFSMDPAKIEAAITPRTKAILPVHVFGQMADMTAIMDIARRHGLAVIEDACEAPLATHRGQLSGSMGDLAVFAFYPNKQMTTGEGGMITTNNEYLYRLCKSMRNQGRGDSLQWLSHDRLGYNYRISELTAALGVVQTQRLPEFIEKRRRLVGLYEAALGGTPGLQLPQVRKENEHTWFVYAVRVSAALRDALLEALNQHGVQSKAYFYPCIHLQTFYREQFGFREGDFPVSEQLSHEIVILPFFSDMSDEQLYYVADTLKRLLRELQDQTTA